VAGEEYQGVKMSWVELDRIVSEEILRDDDIRRRVAESGRPLRSQATGMSDDDLLAKLCGLGVDADREKLAGLCDGALSAEEVVSERLGLHGWDADWAWICLTGLWQRWWPEKACLELLDDKIQEGYDADQRNDFVASSRIWLGAWPDVLRMCDAIGAGSIREFDDRFPMTQSLFNWCQDLEMALQNGGEHDPELRTARFEMAAEWLRRFPSEDGLITGNFRRALADSYFETGHQQKADELYQSWLDDDPAWGWGWIGWADCYTPYGPGKTQDYARAEEILRRGYAVTGVREAEHIAGRLADICGRTGRSDEAGDIRREAEKDRQHAGRRVPRATARAAPTAPAGEPRAAKQHPAGKTGRNQPCPCGSGKKLKKCCGSPASA
jgi:tetratricopeptide (TPR) repeat protein